MRQIFLQLNHRKKLDFLLILIAQFFFLLKDESDSVIEPHIDKTCSFLAQNAQFVHEKQKYAHFEPSYDHA